MQRPAFITFNFYIIIKAMLLYLAFLRSSQPELPEKSFSQILRAYDLQEQIYLFIYIYKFIYLR